MADYTSDFSFTIDSVSSNTYGLFVDTLEPVPHAQQNYTTGTTSKPFAIPDGTYEPITYTINMYKFYPSSMDDSSIRLFLSKGSILCLSNLTTVYFKILTINTKISQRADNKRIDYEVKFTLEPYRYGINNPWAIITSGATISNAGTINAYPLIELTNPDGDITITVNNVDYELKGLTPSNSETPNLVFIDRELFAVYDHDNMLLVGKDSGKLPELVVGNNTITWSGTVEKVRIKVNWREI